jgi:hypothetical protein
MWMQMNEIVPFLVIGAFVGDMLAGILCGGIAPYRKFRPNQEKTQAGSRQQSAPQLPAMLTRPGPALVSFSGDSA